MLYVAICDDNKEMREYLKKLVQPMEAVRAETYENGEKLLASGRVFDIALLDICMTESETDAADGRDRHALDGMLLAKKLRHANPNIIIIFITALREYVFDAFDVGAFHYLIKPIDEDKFDAVMKKAVMRAELVKAKEPLIIKMNGERHCIPVNTILYAENDARKIALHTTKGIFSFYEKMDVLERKLGGDFFRSHRGFLVHLQEVSGYDTTCITLKNGEKIFLSKQRYHAFVSAYMHYLTR